MQKYYQNQLIYRILCANGDVSVMILTFYRTSNPRAMIAHLRVNKYSHWTKCFFPYMGMTVILVKFQAYGCNGFHRIIGPVNAYQRPSCHFFPMFPCLPMFPKSTFTYINHIPSSITFQFSGCNSFQKITF